MSLTDEKIAKFREEKRKRKKCNLSESFYFEGEEWTFEETDFCDKSFSMKIPNCFSIMDKKIAAIKYQYEARPDIILTNQNCSVNFTLSYLDVKIKSSELKKTSDDAKDMIKRLNPSYQFIDEEIKRLDDIYVCMYNFISSAMDADIYNINFMSSLNDKVLIGSFNCQVEDAVYLNQMACQVLFSLKELSNIKKESGKNESKSNYSQRI